MTTLPVIDPERTEFGFARTKCGCTNCREHCTHTPGNLVPADLERLFPGKLSSYSWVRRYLRASPGAIVAKAGRVFRIHTLVPARKEDGSCIFLEEDGCCGIHELAPYGCAFFDCHQSKAEADQRSVAGLNDIAQAFFGDELYAKLWRQLHEAGLTVPGPETTRR